MNTVKATSSPEDELSYWPAFLAKNKKGRPKNNVHQKSVVDLIKESATKKCKTKKKMFCKIFHKFNHNTEDCFKNPVNQL